MLSAALKPQDQCGGDGQENRNEVRCRHQGPEDFAAPRIVAQELDEVTLDSVQDHKSAKHLPIEPPALEQPDQQQEIEELSRSFDQLGWFDPDAERSSADGIRQMIVEGHAPQVIGCFAVTTARRETTEASEDLAERKPRSEAVAGASHRHTMTPPYPDRH